MDSNNERIIKLTKILIFLCGIFLIFPIILFILPQVRELKNNFAHQYTAIFYFLFSSFISFSMFLFLLLNIPYNKIYNIVLELKRDPNGFIERQLQKITVEEWIALKHPGY